MYVIKCQSGTHYVGTTATIQARICEHFAGQGAQWTMKNAPISVIEAIECPDGNGFALESAKTAEYMMRYGWKKVRGGGFTRCDAPGPPAWFDETGLNRLRAVKGKEDGPSPDTDGKEVVVLRGNAAEWVASDEACHSSEVETGAPAMD